jgi:hypothetical protein
VDSSDRSDQILEEDAGLVLGVFEGQPRAGGARDLSIETRGETLAVGATVELFETRLAGYGNVFDLSPDGQRLLPSCAFASGCPG